MRCPNCETELENNAVFCPECGMRVEGQPEQRAMFCSNCGERLEEDSVFCPNCGTRAESREDADEITVTAGQYQQEYHQQNGSQFQQEYRQQNGSQFQQEYRQQNGSQFQQEYRQQNTGQSRQGYGQQNVSQPKPKSGQKPVKLKEKASEEAARTSKAPIIAAVVIGVILIIGCILVAVKLINKEKDSNKKEDLQNTGTLVGKEEVSKDDENAGDADEKGDVTKPDTEESVSVTPKPTATPTPEPTEEPLTISVANTKPDISSYFKVNVSAATATSTIVQEGHDNSALKAFDGDETTSWQEGVDGYGIGEGITGYFDKAYNVKYIFLKLGNWRDVANNADNSRPQTITITCDGFTQQFTFPDEQREFYIELSKEVSMTYVDIKIDAVYPGGKYDDTVIADVAIYGK